MEITLHRVVMFIASFQERVDARYESDGRGRSHNKSQSVLNGRKGDLPTSDALL